MCYGTVMVGKRKNWMDGQGFVKICPGSQEISQVILAYPPEKVSFVEFRVQLYQFVEVVNCLLIASFEQQLLSPVKKLLFIVLGQCFSRRNENQDQ